MKLMPNERTEIRIIPAATCAFCHHCHKVVKPNVIVSAFLSLPLSICPWCSSVIQYREKEIA